MAASTNEQVKAAPIELMRLTTAGSVDDGKSTLIGRLLFDAKQIFEDQLSSLESDSKRYSFDVTRCKYVEMYNDLGFGDLGAIFSCPRDFEFVAGFNPELNLKRSQTIMQGATHCDFRYSAKPESE